MMKSLALLLLASSAVVHSSQYSVIYDGSVYTMTQDGSSTGVFTSNASYASFKVGVRSGSVNFSTPLQVFTSSTGVTLNLTYAGLSLYSSYSDSIIAYDTSLGNHVFKTSVVNATSNAFYYDDAAALQTVCGPFLDNTFGAATCFDVITGFSVATFVNTYTSDTSASPRRIDFNLDILQNSRLSTMISIAIYRIHTAEVQAAVARSISTTMTTRGSQLKTFAGGLYVTILLELTILSTVAAYFFAFIPYKFCAKKFAMFLNLIFILVLGIILCAAAGLIGFFAFQGFLLLTVIVAPIAKCLCCKNSDHDPWGGETSSTEASCCEKMTNWRTVLLVLAGVILIFDISWIVSDNITTYEVYSRPDGVMITEYQPYLIVKSLSAVYAYKNIAQTPLQVNKLFQVATSACGSEFTATVAAADKSSKIYDSWVKKYSVNMNLFVPSNYSQYNSVNDWFVRNINMTFRPISFLSDATVVTSPADSRVVGFQNVGTDQEVWLKGDTFTVSQLVNGNAIQSEFPNASLVIARLSPQDYHRFHSPVTGVVRKMFTITGEYQSVNSDAVTSGNEVLVKNVRSVAVIDVPINGQNTTVLYVAVGANCVGSVKYMVSAGSSITKGQNIGYFQFGGSTVVMVYQQQHVQISDDIQRNSFLDVETYLNVGDIIATLS